MTTTWQSVQLADGGTILFSANFLDLQSADELFDLLRDPEGPSNWQQEFTRWGTPFPRLVGYFADSGVSYTYSGVTHQAKPWLPVLAELRGQIEEVVQAPFNSLLLNYYRDGSDSMGYHADDELELGQNPIVPSISLGATRIFSLKHNETGERRTFELTHGSLLVMSGTLQHYWKHAVLRTKRPIGPRINLTFRNLSPLQGS